MPRYFEYVGIIGFTNLLLLSLVVRFSIIVTFVFFIMHHSADAVEDRCVREVKPKTVVPPPHAIAWVFTAIHCG